MEDPNERRFIPGFDGYAISKNGEVFSYRTNFGINLVRPPIRMSTNGAKWKSVRLRLNSGGPETHDVHELLGRAYIPNPDNLQYVVHINRNMLDNRIENLTWWHNRDYVPDDNWVQVIDFPDYEISRSGIRNAASKRMLKPLFNEDDYPTVGLYKDKKNSIFKIHRLMAIHFIPNPENLPIVDHIDGDITNYSLENLRWSTYSDNLKYAYESGARSREYKKADQSEIPGEKWAFLRTKTQSLNNRYEVSSKGRIRIVLDGHIMSNRFHETTKYHSITLTCDDGRITLLIHRLMAQAFIGDISEMDVDHIDENRENNILENLRIVTRKNHQRDGKGIGVVIIRLSDNRFFEYRSLTETAEALEISIPSVSKAVADNAPRGDYVFFRRDDPLLQELFQNDN